MQVDPLAEQYGSLSAYHYSGNNPVMFNDPNGDRYMQIQAPRYSAGYESIMGYASGGGTTTNAMKWQNYYAQEDYEMALMGAQYGNASALEYLGAETIYSDGKFNTNSNSVTGYMVYSLDRNGHISGDVEVTIDGFNIYSGAAQQVPPGDADNWWSNLGTAARLTAGWAFWFGDDETFNNDRVAKALLNSRIVGEGRDYWYKKVNSGNPITTSVTNFAGITRLGGGNFGLTGLWSAGIDPIEQFIGSTSDFSITSDGTNLRYTITNTTSFKSLMYGLTPEWLNFYNTHQTYIFSEPIDFNRINK